MKASKLEQITTVCILSYFEIIEDLANVFTSFHSFMKDHSPQLSEQVEVRSVSYFTDRSSRWTQLQKHLQI